MGLNPDSGSATGDSTQGDEVAGASTASKSGQHLFSADGAPLSPNVAPSDGLAPDTFFTYQIVFVPDLTQKYRELTVKEGGVGEIRAAMNLVNGWQFTGIGPYYMKDSSTAQNILSAGISTRLGGQAVADVDETGASICPSDNRNRAECTCQRLKSGCQSHRHCTGFNAARLSTSDALQLCRNSCVRTEPFTDRRHNAVERDCCLHI